MIGIIVTGHGNFGTGLTSSLELITGKHENYCAIDFIEGMNTEELANKYIEAIRNMSSCSGILVLSDLAGGSPFKTAVTVAQSYANIEVIAGTNLPLLLEASMMKNMDDDVTSFANKLINTAQESILRFDLVALKVQQVSSDDGI